MPVTPSEETEQHAPGAITDELARQHSSKTESTASGHPVHTQPERKGEPVQFQYHKATPGPVIPQDFTAQEEGTKEERRRRGEELNK
jgi:hypothetical protein